MKIIILLVVAYLLGSIPSGVWIGKFFFKKDIRQYGSGNTGTTNTFRVLGGTAGSVVFLMDLLKGTIATCLPYLFSLPINPLVFGTVAVLGHIFPIFTHFKGGKAVATSAGMLLAYNPTFFVFSFLLYFVILYITSMVSLTSMIQAVIVTLSTIILPMTFPTILPHFDWLLTTIAIIITTFIFILHRGNIKRIKNGTESRINFGLSKNRR